RDPRSDPNLFPRFFSPSPFRCSSFPYHRTRFSSFSDVLPNLIPRFMHPNRTFSPYPMSGVLNLGGEWAECQTRPAVFRLPLRFNLDSVSPRGGCAIKKKSRSILSSRRRGGVQPQQNSVEFDHHPVRSIKEASRHFIDVASTPPRRGGENSPP